MVHGVEGRLEGVGVEDAKLLEHHDPTSRLFLLFISELAVREGEKFVFLAEEVRDYTDEVVIFVLVDL